MKNSIVALIVVAMFMLAACRDPGARQAKGFRLPEGDAKAGREAFIALSCHTCHTVDGISLPDPASKGQYSVKLGGMALRVRSYGDLVTAIVHPAHDITKPFKSAARPEQVGEKTDNSEVKKSPMPDFNNIITAQQLIDITTFLHSRYKEMPQEDYMFMP